MRGRWGERVREQEGGVEEEEGEEEGKESEDEGGRVAWRGREYRDKLLGSEHGSLYCSWALSSAERGEGEDTFEES